jgi:hypothetical protein
LNDIRAVIIAARGVTLSSSFLSGLLETDAIALHGGYRHLKIFQVAQLACDVTVRFPSPGGE